jgi:UDP-glucose:tetrahydrobiopterin glucosyltransferase
VGNGFDLSAYQFRAEPEPLLGWVGRVAPEKGLEDAAAAAARCGMPLAVWGLVEDEAYAAAVQASVPAGTLQWRGFLPTAQLQGELGCCRALLNTPKWNEAYGWLVEPDDVTALAEAVKQVEWIDRSSCRQWVELHASREVLAERIEAWLEQGLKP